MENKIEELETLIQDENPLILGISESNLFGNHDISNVKIKNYDLITADTMSNPNINVSRVVIYKHVSVSAKVRHDLMDSTFSSIWIEIQLPKNKNFLLCHLYREHQYLRQSDDKSLSPDEQLNRWSVFLQQWERALETNLESVVMGDTNVDHFLINSQDLSRSRHKPFINLLSEK